MVILLVLPVGVRGLSTLSTVVDLLLEAVIAFLGPEVPGSFCDMRDHEVDLAVDSVDASSLHSVVGALRSISSAQCCLASGVSNTGRLIFVVEVEAGLVAVGRGKAEEGSEGNNVEELHLDGVLKESSVEVVSKVKR